MRCGVKTPSSRRVQLALVVASTLSGVPGAVADEDFARCSGPGSDLKLAACTRIVQRKPAPSPDVLAVAAFDRAIALKDGGDPAAARQALNTSIGVKPLAAAYFLRGVIAMDDGDLPAALADYDAALVLEPDNVSVLVDKSLVLDRRGDIQGAMVTVESALKRAPGDATALNQRGNLYGKMGDNRRAEEDWARAAALDSQLAGFFARKQRVVRVMVPPPASFPSPASVPPPAGAMDVTALVIGENAHPGGVLMGVAQDVADVSQALIALGVKTATMIDVDRNSALDAIRTFAAGDADSLHLLYFSGAGGDEARAPNELWFLGKDEAGSGGSDDIETLRLRHAVPFPWIAKQLGQTAASIIIIDSSLNPTLEAGARQVVVASGSHGREDARGGFFTRHIVARLREAGHSALPEVFASAARATNMQAPVEDPVIITTASSPVCVVAARLECTMPKAQEAR